jgi:hypothetical protein
MPKLSVVLATTDAWPDLANCLAVLEPQVQAVDGELIVGDGDGRALPERYASDPGRVVWIRKPGASVFQLRAEGVARATGDIIATTEDHCIVAPDWCRRILDAFDQNPGVDAVAGGVLNGSTESRTDWANFLHTFGAFVPPVDPAQRSRSPVNANIAYRRSLIEGAPPEPGWMELTLNGRLFRERRFHFDDRIVVTHVQSHGFLGTLRSHFDNGRATSGLQPLRLSRRQLPWRLFRNTLNTMKGKPGLASPLRSCTPMLLALSCCHSAGEIAGILFGPGKSPARLR